LVALPDSNRDAFQRAIFIPLRWRALGVVTSAAEALPDNPDLLKAMVLAERAESERLRQIIRELQRHRFGRRAESLPEEQLQLGLEEAEQAEAAGLSPRTMPRPPGPSGDRSPTSCAQGSRSSPS
jgi:hypothetical protein